LAPEITKAIIRGRQPRGFNAINLMRAGQFALPWPDQRRELGFD
jgi:site-specific DNA recombinase